MPQTLSKIPVGTKRKDGKIWAGPDFGFQSPATFKKLDNSGAFKHGAQQIRRVSSSASRMYEQHAPQALKDFAKWYGETEERANQRLLDRGHTQAEIDKFYENRGRPDATQRATSYISDATNVAPEIISATAFALEGAAEGFAGRAMARRTLRGLSRAPAPSVHAMGPQDLANTSRNSPFRSSPNVVPSRAVRRDARLGTSSRIDTGELVPANRITNDPIPANVTPPKPREPNPPATGYRDGYRVDIDQVQREAWDQARDPIATERVAASVDASNESLTRELRASRRRTPARPRPTAHEPRTWEDPTTRSVGPSVTQGHRSVWDDTHKAPPRKSVQNGDYFIGDGGIVPRNSGQLSPLQQRLADKARVQNARLRRAQQRIRTEAGVKANNNPMTDRERRAMARHQDQFGQQHQESTLHQHNADDTWREYHSDTRKASQSERAFAEGGDYSGDRYTDTGGFDARFDRAGVENNVNPGYHNQITDITGAGEGKRGATGALRGTFDVEQVKKDLKKAGIDPRTDPKAAREFIRKNYSVQTYGPDADGNTRSVVRPGNKAGSKPGTVKTNSTLDDKVKKELMDRRFSEQFNQIEADAAEGSTHALAARRDRARRRSDTPEYADEYRSRGGKELDVPDRAKTGASSKTREVAKHPDNIPGGSHIPQSDPGRARRATKRSQIRKSDIKDGSVDWKDTSKKRPSLVLEVKPLPKNPTPQQVAAHEKALRAQALRSTVSERQFQRMERAQRGRRRIRSQFEVMENKPDGSLEFNPRAANRFQSGRTRMESRGSGKADKPKINSSVSRDPVRRRNGTEAPADTADNRKFVRRDRASGDEIKSSKRGTGVHRDHEIRTGKAFGSRPGAGSTKPTKRRTSRAIRREDRNLQLTPAQQERMNDLKAGDDQFNEFYPSGELRGVRGSNTPRGARKQNPTAHEQDFVKSAKKNQGKRAGNRDRTAAELKKQQKEMEKIRLQRVYARLRRVRGRLN